ncbi:LOB domain-containing protein 16-like [Arachis stenosperma]|uniref:LOB domain-containing protein 16-like n=1 Tax=Arachis stenosperma TaxID=217475 RepID=UPI0025AC99A5|nr:LOB domain-containing protein 16-like [Arachis stenosperma]
MASSSSGSPCGACKFLRRKCASDCVFAPYFSWEEGAARFAAIHKVFGASNVSKMLMQIPSHERCEAVLTIAYEAQARIRDPVYGCVSHIFALQQQVACLQAQLMQVKAQLAHQNMQNHHNQWNNNNIGVGQTLLFNNYNNNNNQFCPTNNDINYMPSPQSCSLDESIDQSSIISDGIMSMLSTVEDFSFQACSKRISSSYNDSDLSELQELALRMMRNYN